MVLSAACFEEFGAICPVPEAGGLGALQAPLDLLGQRSGGVWRGPTMVST